jgi:hypothetical protein
MRAFFLFWSLSSIEYIKSMFFVLFYIFYHGVQKFKWIFIFHSSLGSFNELLSKLGKEWKFLNKKNYCNLHEGHSMLMVFTENFIQTGRIPTLGFFLFVQPQLSKPNSLLKIEFHKNKKKDLLPNGYIQ